MIYGGENGSINGYFKKKLIVSRPLGKGKSLETYKKESLRVLIEALREGNTIPNIKKLAFITLKNFRYEQTIREPTAEDRDFVLLTLLILIKLGVVEEDGDQEGLLIMGKKKPKRETESRSSQY
tara:strand:+ start:1272 stop:1643 length:372 start_codon:yes stop_codon:yes gene_type:complete